MFLCCWWECKLIQPLWMRVWRVLKKLGIKPPQDPTIPLLGIYPEETKIEKDMYPVVHCSTMYNSQHMVATQSPSTDEWIKKLCYINTMEYYSAIKRNTFESVPMRWMNPEPIILSKVSQKEKDKYCILMHIYGIQKNSTEEFTYRAAIEKQTYRVDYGYGEQGRRG